jgi:hypothetical protein
MLTRSSISSQQVYRARREELLQYLRLQVFTLASSVDGTREENRQLHQQLRSLEQTNMYLRDVAMQQVEQQPLALNNGWRRQA